MCWVLSGPVGGVEEAGTRAGPSGASKGPYDPSVVRPPSRVTPAALRDLAWTRTQTILREMELAVDQEKYGYKRFGAPTKPLVPLKRLSPEEKEEFM